MGLNPAYWNSYKNSNANQTSNANYRKLIESFRVISEHEYLAYYTKYCVTACTIKSL